MNLFAGLKAQGERVSALIDELRTRWKMPEQLHTDFLRHGIAAGKMTAQGFERIDPREFLAAHPERKPPAKASDYFDPDEWADSFRRRK
jgi:hypothetical protein